MKKYQKGKLIGSGNFGSVYELKCLSTGKLYALKELKYNKQLLMKRFPKFNRELQSLQVLSHPNIVEFIETFENEQDKVCIVMDLCSKGDLTQYITSASTNLTDKQKLELFGQILEGMYYIHSQDYMHRDLKPDNIMLNEDGVAKIGDFGMIKKFQNDIINSVAGTPLYASPQVLDQSGVYTQKCDVFSMGLILFFIVFQYDLFHQARKMNELIRLQESITRGQSLKSFIKKLECGEDFKKIFELTLPYEQSKRCSMAQLRQWFLKTLKPEPTPIKSQEQTLNYINSFFLRIYKQVNLYNQYVPILKDLESDKTLKIKTIKRYVYIILIGCGLIVEYSKVVEAVKSEDLSDFDFVKIRDEWLHRISGKIKEYTHMCQKAISQITSKKGHRYLEQNPAIEAILSDFKSSQSPSNKIQYNQLLKTLILKETDAKPNLLVQRKAQFLKRIQEML